MTIFIAERTDGKGLGGKAIEAESLVEAAGTVLTALMVSAKGEITVNWNSSSVLFRYSVDPSQPPREMQVVENGPIYG